MSTDRAAFITAIRLAPTDDTARLVYADWLDEFGAGDFDRATSEFIRMSCAKPGAKVMPRKVYPWLLSKGEDGLVVENWKRLVPTLVKEHQKYSRYGEEPFGLRSGRLVRSLIEVAFPSPHLPKRRHAYVVWAEFHRGFVSSFTVSALTAARHLFSAVVADHPLVDLHFAGLSVLWHPRQAAEMLNLVRSLQGEKAAELFAKRHA